MDLDYTSQLNTIIDLLKTNQLNTLLYLCGLILLILFYRGMINK